MSYANGVDSAGLHRFKASSMHGSVKKCTSRKDIASLRTWLRSGGLKIMDAELMMARCHAPPIERMD